MTRGRGLYRVVAAPRAKSTAALGFEPKMERVKGIEPSCAAWEAAVLPLNYTRQCQLSGNSKRTRFGFSRPNAPLRYSPYYVTDEPRTDSLCWPG